MAEENALLKIWNDILAGKDVTDPAKGVNGGISPYRQLNWETEGTIPYAALTQFEVLEMGDDGFPVQSNLALWLQKAAGGNTVSDQIQEAEIRIAKQDGDFTLTVKLDTLTLRADLIEYKSNYAVAFAGFIFPEYNTESTLNEAELKHEGIMSSKEVADGTITKFMPGKAITGSFGVALNGVIQDDGFTYLSTDNGDIYAIEFSVAPEVNSTVEFISFGLANADKAFNAIDEAITKAEDNRQTVETDYSVYLADLESTRDAKRSALDELKKDYTREEQKLNELKTGYKDAVALIATAKTIAEANEFETKAKSALESVEKQWAVFVGIQKSIQELGHDLTMIGNFIDEVASNYTLNLDAYNNFVSELNKSADVYAAVIAARNPAPGPDAPAKG